MTDTPNAAHLAAAAALVEAAAPLSGEALSRRLNQAQDSGYWRDLNPRLGIGNAPPTHEDGEFSGETARRWAEEFSEKGYFHTGAVFTHDSLVSMRAGIERLRMEGWPPVFAYVYDEYWIATRAPVLCSLMEAVLGPGFRQTSHVWCHYVDATPRAAGWPPHIDGHRQDTRVTAWIPLTDATLDNGCMYVVPKDAMPASLKSEFHLRESFDFEEASALLQGAHAIPVSAGSILCWDYEVLHWGSRYRRDETPRINLACAFIGKDTKPTSKEPPLFGSDDPLPEFGERLRIVANVILRYQKREPMRVRRYLALADALGGRA